MELVVIIWIVDTCDDVAIGVTTGIEEIRKCVFRIGVVAAIGTLRCALACTAASIAIDKVPIVALFAWLIDCSVSAYRNVELIIVIWIKDTCDNVSIGVAAWICTICKSIFRISIVYSVITLLGVLAGIIGGTNIAVVGVILMIVIIS